MLLKEYIGKTITDLKLENDELNFKFSDGSIVSLFDDGQDCCEVRYMRTDDNLDDYIGATLFGAETREGGRTEDNYEVHEIEFLIVNTSKGSFTMSNHNEHNGYYGGFSITTKHAQSNT